MATEMIFKRVENKYLMDPEQTESVYRALEEHMVLDRYGRSSIRNIYFDTESFLLVRRSNEKPEYKEKLRIRSYGRATRDDDVFVELKKKYDGIVYKRRLTMPYGRAMEWFGTDTDDFPRTQIGQELDYLRHRYPGIRPAMYLTYDREAYSPKDGGDLRITMDSNILARLDDIDLASEPGGHSVLPEGTTLMEIKTMYGYPRWLLDVLNGARLYRSSFTKYGNAYRQMVLGKRPIAQEQGIAAVPDGMMIRNRAVTDLGTDVYGVCGSY